MAARARVRRSPNIWPGFVDALSTLLMVIIFLLVVYMLAQYFLTVALSGRDEALDRLNLQVSELAELLSLEQKTTAELRLGLEQLTTERDALDLRLEEATARVASVQADAEALRAALAEAEETIAADRETLELTLAELARLRQDIAALRAVPAAVRHLSAEPLLGPLDNLDLSGIDWVIAGGESGPGARPMHPGWVRSLRDQCAAAGVPFFFKQWGAWAPAPEDMNFAEAERFAKGRPFEHHTSGHTLVRVGKKKAGATLDGRTHQEFPQTETEVA